MWLGYSLSYSFTGFISPTFRAVMAWINDSEPNLEQMLYYEDIKLRSKRRWWGYVYLVYL